MLTPKQSRYKKIFLRNQPAQQVPAEEHRVHPAEARVIRLPRPIVPMFNLFGIAHQPPPIIQQDDLNFRSATQPG